MGVDIVNPIKQKFADKVHQRAAFVHLPSPALVEMVGLFGFDFVVIDTEHGPTDIETVEHMVRAAECSGVPALIRLPHADPQLANKLLDTGARGILVPHFSSVALAEAFVRAAKYAPLGTRGSGTGTRAARYGLRFTHAEYVQYTNDDCVILGILEDWEAQRELPGLLEVEGVDGFIIGPSDLSESMGRPGQQDDPEVIGWIQDVTRQVVASDKALGRAVLSKRIEDATAEMSQYFDLGADFVFSNTTRLLGYGLIPFLEHDRR